MIWVYMLIYLLGGIITALCVYVYYVKEYIREKLPITFSYWIKFKYETMFIFGLFWGCLVPLLIITYPFEKIIKKIIKRINKHYNLES